MLSATTLLAVTLLGAVPNAAPAGHSLLTVMGTEKAGVQRVSVLRVDPWLQPIQTITPTRVEHAFSQEAVITNVDEASLNSIVDALSNATVYGNGCYNKDYTVAGFRVGWALLLYGDSSRRVGAVYLSENGLCAIISNKLYDVDPSLLIFLRRTFSFMNY